MTFISLIPLITIIAIIILGCLVYSFGAEDRINQFFLLLSFATALWLFSDFMLSQSDTEVDAVLWGKVNAFIWPFPATFFLLFVLSLKSLNNHSAVAKLNNKKN